VLEKEQFLQHPGMKSTTNAPIDVLIIAQAVRNLFQRYQSKEQTVTTTTYCQHIIPTTVSPTIPTTLRPSVVPTAPSTVHQELSNPEWNLI